MEFNNKTNKYIYKFTCCELRINDIKKEIMLNNERENIKKLIDDFYNEMEQFEKMYCFEEFYKEEFVIKENKK